MASLSISPDSDYQINVTGVVDAAGDPIVDATVTATLYESDEETEVSGQTWPETLTADGTGNYSGALSKDLVLEECGTYSLKITIVADDVQRVYRDNVYVDGNGSP